MPNGYRRGGLVHRNGRTFHRRGAHIRPRTVLVGAILLGAALGGTPLIAHPILLATITTAAVAGGGVWAYHHLGHRPGTLTHWAKGHAKRIAKRKVHGWAEERKRLRAGPTRPRANPRPKPSAPQAKPQTRSPIPSHPGTRQPAQRCHYCSRAIQGSPAVTTSGKLTSVWHPACLQQLQRPS